jgi:hypothetical protein
LVLVLLSPVSVFLVGPIWFSFFFGASVPNFVNQFFARCRQVPLPLSLALLWSQVTREDMSSSAPAYSRPDLLLIYRGPDRFSRSARAWSLPHGSVFFYWCVRSQHYSFLPPAIFSDSDPAACQGVSAWSRSIAPPCIAGFDFSAYVSFASTAHCLFLLNEFSIFVHLGVTEVAVPFLAWS